MERNYVNILFSYRMKFIVFIIGIILIDELLRAANINITIFEFFGTILFVGFPFLVIFALIYSKLNNNNEGEKNDVDDNAE